MERVPKPILTKNLGFGCAVALLVLWVSAPVFSAWVPVSSQSEGALPEWRVLSNTPNSTVIEFNLNGYWTENVRENGSDFARLSVPGDHGTTQKVGWPELPTISKMVGLPPTGSVNVRVQDVDYVTYPSAAIYPFQTPLRENDVRVGFDRNDDAYRQASIYPENWVEIEDPGIWRDVRISRMTLHPFRISSATGQLEVARHLIVEVRSSGAGGINPMTRGPHPIAPNFYKMYHAAVINFDQMGYSVLDTDEDPGTQYLVITNTICLPHIQPLVDYRNGQGYKVEVRTLEAGFNHPGEFKAYITNLYHTTGLEYVLLVGDAYYGGGSQGVDVPMYYWNPDPSDPSYSDSWYTCVDPGDDNDHFAELAIGRIVYDDMDELDLQIEKTMHYLLEGDSTDNWEENSLLVAHQEQYPQKYTQCSEEIRTYPYSIQVPHFYTAYGGAGATNQDVINCINGPGVGILNYRGHGSATEWWDWGPTGSFSAPHIAQLTNADRLYVHFDICCDNMDIVAYAGNCFCEEMMKHTSGCVAVLSAIIPSYTIPNHDFDKFLYRGVFDEGINNIGYTSNYANITVLNNHGSLGRSNVRTYLWQGDAAIDVITNTPTPLLVDHPSGVNIGLSSVDIGVATGTGPVEGAMVCVSNDSVYSRGFTNAQGEVTIIFDQPLDDPGSLDLWVTGHNLRPYHAVLDIIMGYGDLNGTVTNAATGSGVEGAVVTVAGPNMADTTDANGDYELLHVPAWSYDVTVEAEGFIAQTVSVTIDSGEVITQDFDLLHAECSVSVSEITEYLESNEVRTVDVTLANGGNGPLDFNIEYDFNPLGLPNPPTDFSETLWDQQADLLTGDEFLNGVEYAWGEFWITGSGGGSNYTFYRFDDEWNFLGSYPQPVIQSLGARDMAFDGEYLWTGDRSELVCLNYEGQEVRRIPGPYNPNRALAYGTHTNHLYTVDRANPIKEIDPVDGTVVQTFPNTLDVMGMGYMPDQGSYGYLYLYTGGSSNDSVCVYSMDVETGVQTFIGRCNEPMNQRAGGCTITNGLDRNRWTFLGLSAGSDDFVRAYNLGFRTGWLTVAPESGTVEGGSDVTLTVTLASGDYQDGDYLADLHILHNAIGGEHVINVTMWVNASDVPEAATVVPTQFRLDQAYPNPFNPSTTIPFALRERTHTKLVVYNVMGQQVAVLVDGMMDAGEHRVAFDGSSLASGLYFYRLEAGSFVQIRKVVMLK